VDIREIGDRLEIMELLARYARGVDTKDWALWRDVFTEDAHVDYRSAGGLEGDRETVAQWLEASLAPFPMTQHYITNVEIELDGDTALVRAMFYNPMRFPGAADGLTLDVLNDLVHTLHPTVDVTAFEVRETFQFGSGQVSTAGRIALRLAYAGPGSDTMPADVMLKVTRPELGALPLYANEVAFYARLRPELGSSVETPRCARRKTPQPLVELRRRHALRARRLEHGHYASVLQLRGVLLHRKREDE